MSEDPTPIPANTPASPPTAPRRRRWRRRLGALFMLLLLGVWFTPTVIAKTRLRNHFAREAFAELRGSVEVGDATLGWFSPVELRDVTIKDEAGRTILNVPKVTSQKSLVALLRNQAEPGEFTLERPTVAIVCAKNTTNLETAFAEYLKEEKSPAPTRTPISVRITGGTLTLTDAETGKITSLEDITASVNVPASRTEPVTAKLTSATGSLVADVVVGESGSAKIVSAGLALDTFTPLLKRIDPELNIAGVVTTDIQVTWGKDARGPMFALAGKVSGKQLAVSTPWMNGDRLSFDSAELPLDVELAGNTIRVRKFDLTCDVGTISATGEFNPDEPLDKLASRPGVSVNANVELAKLVAKLPKLLRVKEGTELREGKLEVKLVSHADAGGVVWEGNVHTSALKAMRDGKPIVWDQPLHVEFAGRYTSGQLPTFDKLICTSDFIAVNAKTTPDTIQAAANIYLHRLGARLAEFVDLGGVTLAGEASAWVVGRRTVDGSFKADGMVELKNFAFRSRSGRGLKEASLKLQLSATGLAKDTESVQLKTATAVLSADGDELRLSLVEPVADVRKLTSGSVDVRITGELARWKSRVGAFVKIPPYAMSGKIVAHGKAKFAAERITVDRLTVGITDAKFRGAGLDIDEPTMNAVGDFTLVRASGVATITNFTLNSVPLTVNGGTLAFEPQPNRDLVVSGNGPCITDLNRLGKTVKLYTD
ncbi:MAG: hypothetical protein L0241_31610, partial [Planctomycetia bacterium]|nr:hypothetical protein [Planctomycetia bacterium]